MIYMVNYLDKDGFERNDNFECGNPGQAFAACLLKHPGATLKRARVESRRMRTELWIDYEPPRVQRDPLPVIRPPRPPKREDKDGTFAFYDQVVSHK